MLKTLRVAAILRRALIVASAAIFGACALPDPRSVSDESLCVRYGNNIRANDPQRAAAIGAEMERRGLRIDDLDVTHIQRQIVRVGMTTCAMRAAWGHSSVDNRTTTARAVRIQHVWRGFTGQYVRTRSSFVYTENGIVVAVQD
jgi:hypothetical protein